MPTLQFKGKTFVQNHHLAVPYHQLIPNKDKSLTEKVSLDDNLIVHGDNLLALKALLPTYAGKVKCIYIDPPYNTGNESWVYNDNVKSPLIKEWIGKVVGKDGEDLVRHDKWLCMMMPRLKLLKELLTPDGLIFMSIDDIEQQHLRTLSDEIFGEENFVANVLWQKRTSPDSRVILGAGHDFVICYTKDKASLSESLNKLELSDEQRSVFKNPDNDPNGSWVSSDFTAQGYRPNQMYKIVTPGGAEYTPPDGRCWKNIEAVYKKLHAEGRMWYGVDGRGMPRRKTYLNEREGHVPWTWWTNKEVGHNQEAKKEIIEILGSSTAFDTPKPTRLIKRILQIATDENSIVLDSFAGSGTTAQAVLEQNMEDGGNRKFILIECEDYADTITAERVRRVIKGVPTIKNELIKKGLGGSFSYFELGDAIEMESLLAGKSLPEYTELARYLFYTATGEEFKPEKVNESTNFIGSTDDFDVYAYYKPDLQYLKTTALTLDEARSLRAKVGSKPLLVFAPTKYVEQQTLDELNITFCQLPFEIYRMKK